MTIISGLVGGLYERHIQDRFPEITVNTKPNYPDFDAGDFHIEAKAGNKEYGIRLKRYQVERFQDIENPVIYLIGFHNLTGLNFLKNKLSKSALIKHAIQNISFPLEYAVSADIIEGIWEGEHRLSKKKEIEYCPCKPRFLEYIIRGGTMIRQEKEVDVHEYYGINSSEYVLHSPSNNKIGILLRKNQKQVLAFLKNKKVI